MMLATIAANSLPFFYRIIYIEPHTYHFALSSVVILFRSFLITAMICYTS